MIYRKEIKISVKIAGEWILWLRALTYLPDDPGSFPGCHIVVYKHLGLQCWESAAF